MLKLSFLPLASLFTVALGHGLVTTPIPRSFGQAALAACGSGAFKSLTSDLTGPIENAAKAADSGFNAAACNLFFCRGAQFADNTDKVNVFQTGQKVPFLVNIKVRHTGVANVSVVDLNTQTPIGQPLFNWPVYTDTSIAAANAPKNETDFSVTIPDLGTRCQTAGSCAIQWWWFASNGQSYESCVDFVTSA
ncbi:hypothetical protein B0H34DRAFT_676606 [Crassisporium funariophilum]|nr:hypothetical protein B0H34DRAFT_676606 [Crassisporium funariophilum]